MQRYLSRYCTFEVPDEWVEAPPLGYAEVADDEDATSVRVIERWLDEPTSAEVYAAGQKELLPHLLDEVEFLEEGPWSGGGSAGGRPDDGAGNGLQAGYSFRLRFKTEDGYPAFQRLIYLARGPFLAELALLRLDEPGRDGRVLDAIARTFRLRPLEFLAGVQKLALFSGEGAAAPEASALHGAHSFSAADATPWERKAFPRCCVSIPLPPDWQLSEDDGSPIFTRSDFEISLRRLIGHAGGAAEWVTESMKRLDADGDRLLGTERGEQGGYSWAALISDSKDRTRTWKSAADRRVLEVFVEADQPLLWRLQAPEPALTGGQSVVEALAAGTEFLPPAEWQTKLSEPWVDLVLKGPWRSEGPGVYINFDEQTLVYLSAQKNESPLETLRPALLGSFSQSVGVRLIVSEEQEQGQICGLDAFRLSVDGVADDGRPQSLRAIWVVADNHLHSLMAQGKNRERVNPLFLKAVGLLRFSGGDESPPVSIQVSK